MGLPTNQHAARVGAEINGCVGCTARCTTNRRAMPVPVLITGHVKRPFRRSYSQPPLVVTILASIISPLMSIQQGRRKICWLIFSPGCCLFRGAGYVWDAETLEITGPQTASQLGYGVIGNTLDSDSSIPGSSPGTPAIPTHEIC